MADSFEAGPRGRRPRDETDSKARSTTSDEHRDRRTGPDARSCRAPRGPDARPAPTAAPVGPGYEHDVFVSYSREDRDLVKDQLILAGSSALNHTVSA